MYVFDDLLTTDLHDAPVPVQEVRGDTPPCLLCRPVAGSLHLHQMFGKVLLCYRVRIIHKSLRYTVALIGE